MRWAETCTLVAKDYTPDNEGVPQPVETTNDVFCNAFKVGASTWSSMYEIGISVDAELQIRSCDYDGQRDLVYRGKWYSIEFVKEEGDFTRLTIRHQKSDSAETAESAESAESSEVESDG